MKVTAKLLNKADFEKKIIEQLSNKVGRKRKSIENLIEETINSTIDKYKKLFMPSREEAGALGIGFGGNLLTDKINNAYKGLYVGAAGKLQTKFTKTRAFGEITYSVDKDDFYELDASKYFSTRGAFGLNGEEVKWMRNFVEGLKINNYTYVDRSSPLFNETRSRTGLGHMQGTQVIGRIILGGSFRFRGDTSKYKKVEEALVKKITTKVFLNKIKKIIVGG